MRYSIWLPRVGHPEGRLSPDDVAEVAVAVERAGLHACNLTDHPFPITSEARHTELDPLVTLGYVAGATRSLLLHTNVVVLPYRNPFMLAREALTLDLLSGGRLVLGLGVGFLREEFEALGIDFDARGKIMDESLEAMRAAWSGEPLTMSTPRWKADGNFMVPLAARAGGPKVWVGGNGSIARQRAVTHGQGWTPFQSIQPAAGSKHVSSLDVLAAGIEDLRRLEAEHDIDTPLDVCLVRSDPSWLQRPTDAIVEELEALESIGVTWMGVRFAALEGPELIDAVERFASDVARVDSLR